MKKRMMSLLVVLLLCLAAFSSSVLAFEAEGLDNFQKTNIYTLGQFSDVPAGVWYETNVKTAYELGLVSGTGDGTTYSPNDNITLGSVLALACRLHSIYYTGQAEFIQGSPWYQVYVDYAVLNGIITEDQYSDYTIHATRQDVAAMLARAVPGQALEQTNTVDDNMIPDVPVQSAFSQEIYTLYRAGVLTGSDASGTFNPETNIDRASVTAMVTRVADPTLRREITLAAPAQPEPTPEPAPDPGPAPAPDTDPSTDPEPDPAPQARTVYITPTGKRYHYDDSCNGGTYIPSTLEEALSKNLTPCQKCVG